MSFWNYLGELALFNVIRNCFTGKPKHDVYPYQQNFSADPDPGYTNQVDALTRKINDMKRELAESKRQHGLTDDEINGLYDDIDERDDIDDSDLYDDPYYGDDSYLDPDEDW